MYMRFDFPKCGERITGLGINHLFMYVIPDNKAFSVKKNSFQGASHNFLGSNVEI